MLRRGFRAIALTLLFVCLSPAQEAVRSVTILHTNDLHARLLPLDNGHGGFANLATVIRREKADCTSCLMLNAGDLVQGSPVSTLFHGLPVYEIANLLGFDISTLGNHDFDYGWEVARKFTRMANYAIVSANVADESGRLLTEKPYLIREVNGVRVAVIGAVTDGLASLTTPNVLGPWHNLPLLDTVRRYAAEVRGQSDLIVLLAHITDLEEKAVLHEIPGIAVVVSGHLHTGLQNPLEFDGRLAVRVKGYAEELGRLALQVDVSKKSVVSWNWKRILVDSKAVPAAEDVAKEVQHWEGEVSKVVDVPLAESSRQYSHAEVKRLVERALREEMGADFAFMNSGGVRDIIPRGKLLVRHVWNIIPFDNRAVMGTFKGRELPSTVTADHAIEPEREYKLTTSDFTAANQSAPGELGSKGLVFPENGPLLRDLLIDWIRKQKVL